ncbi:MAG: polyprenyl synthetase family protein [Pseudomonadota bacterium]
MLTHAFEPIRNDLFRMEEAIANRSICGVDMADAIVRHMMKNAGKRIRPAIFLLAARASQPATDELDHNIIDIAAAVELIHTASLLHDDVVDSSNLRRGAITANAKWGDEACVLAGDFLWCVASEIIVRIKNHKLTSAVIEGVRHMTEGQIMEVACRNSTCIDENTCLKIIEAKTASLFSTASRLGAIVSEKNSSHEQSLSEYGRCVGIAFQLADDALDYVASTEALGKKPKSDLITKTPTYPLISALNNATAEDAWVIEQALKSDSLDEQTLSDVCNIVKKCSGITLTLTLAKYYSAKAKEHLCEFEPCAEIDSLKAIADYASSRN